MKIYFVFDLEDRVNVFNAIIIHYCWNHMLICGMGFDTWQKHLKLRIYWYKNMFSQFS